MKIKETLLAERDRLILWAPACLMVGIGIYFSLEREPPISLGLAVLCASLLPLMISWRSSWRFVGVALLLMALGFTAGEIRARLVDTPILARPLEFANVEGTIEEIEPFEEKTKLVVGHLVIEGVAPGDTPRRVRVSFRGNDPNWQAGDRIRFTASLYPLQRPVMPGGYDFARHFYFRSIGGSGYAMRAPEILENAARSNAELWLSNLRRHIGDDMRRAIPGPVGAVAAAMTVGETGPIPEDVKTDLRDSGLAHMLSISGLHLGIAAGVVFFTLRLLLTLVPAIALHWPVKKISAAFALVSALLYLLLAGCPVPAQRAFIMVAFVFVAVLLDRRGVTLRTLAIAAILILLLFPEAMFGASFQLSFAATLAIVALFERFGRSLHFGGNWWWRSLSHVVGVILTSLAATIATMPFVLYHFNRLAIFGLVANTLVIPLATFIIMPGMVLSLLLMPLGLQAIGYVPLAWGTRWMLAMGHWVTEFPFASLRLFAPTDIGLLMCAFGMLWLCLLQTRWRLLGLPLLLLGLSTIALQRPYDMLIDEEGKKIMVRLEDGDFLFVRGRPTSFDGLVWLRYHGREEGLTLADMEDKDCTKEYCRMTLHEQHLAIARRNDVAGLCDLGADIVITSENLPEHCKAPLRLDHEYLQNYGPVGIRFTQSGIDIEKTVPQPGRRVWNVHSSLYAPDNPVITSP